MVTCTTKPLITTHSTKKPLITTQNMETCTTEQYLYVGGGEGHSQAELFDMSSPFPFQASVPDQVPDNPPNGPLYGYAAVQTKRGIMRCGGLTGSSVTTASNKCFLFSESGSWETEQPMSEKRAGHTMVQKGSEVWVAGGYDASGM